VSAIRELWAFLKWRRKYRLLPVILCILIVGALAILSQGSVFAPFIYPLF
jgi:hypothetical protein